MIVMDTFLLLEQKSREGIFLNRIEAGSHFLGMLSVVFSVVSLGKLEVAGIFPYFLYPLVMITGGRAPLKTLLKIYVTVLPLFFFFALSNLLFAGETILFLGRYEVREGVVMSLSLVLKGMVSILSVLSFISLKGFSGLSKALMELRVPRFFVLILSLTVRYIALLLEEVSVIIRAYHLRAPGRQGVYWKDWGPLGGQWFIRTYKRAERIQNAIDCRGGQAEYSLGVHSVKPGLPGVLWFLFWLIYSVTVFRLGNTLAGPRMILPGGAV